ncbi:MAG TPA: polyhydroxyalkanoate synthesis regulator DNA-binding domain-containing protein [Myxococcales bacterium LLY-WYZ-16_1]|jgi:polyhydroxyalkanoate synthesis repressor PhaR|nr:polyhydroxyalkanoate synthesis regulator DNA-binding domain-containing protein [Myxococcales bacterium LLY-WYZ-16_1]
MTTSAQAPDPHGQVKARIIKRYSNRKLYDTERSRYVTLEEISKMIKAGDEVTIIDNESKEDLTSVTLTQIIYEEEKRESRMPLGMLRHLIQSSGSTLHDFFDKSVITPVGQARESVEKGVEEIRQSAVHFREAATRSVSELTESARRIFSREEHKAEEFRRTFIQLFDALEERIDSRIQDVRATHERMAQDALHDASAPKPADAQSSLMTDSHVSALRERLTAIHQLVDQLEATARAGHGNVTSDPSDVDVPPDPSDTSDPSAQTS